MNTAQCKGRRAGFTLIELLVVVAIIALLLSILLPSLSGAREQGKRAKCLANLSSIGKAIQQYASEDRAEQVIPIGTFDMEPRPQWVWRTANWFCWGGRSAQKPFRAGGSLEYWLTNDEEVAGGGSMLEEYAASRRPLNVYMIGDISENDANEMEWFECPSDTGYPDSADVDDSPPEQAERRCYDTMGNSYRASKACYASSTGQHSENTNGNFAVGPWGHRLTTLLDTGRLVLMGEPTWFNMIGKDDGSTDKDPVLLYGWHKRKLIDNLAYCDGSARSTKVVKEYKVDEDAMWDVHLVAGIHRGATYRLDVYPVGGAIIFERNNVWSNYIKDPSIGRMWPWKNHQDNLH